jgi:hypothetical protein
LIIDFLVHAIPSLCFNIKAFQVTDARGGARGEGRGGERGLIPRNEKISTSGDETNREGDILDPSASAASDVRE